MNQIIKLVGSMKTMAVLMLIFAVMIGYATFVENDFGTQTAKAEVYNARWFEVLLGLLAVNLVLNIVNYRMVQRKKIAVLLFHLSFLVILLGAAVTRYMGYEGTMHIREGAVQNRMLSQESHLKFVFTKEGKQYVRSEPLLLSKLSDNRFARTFDLEGETVSVRLESYIPNAGYELVEDPSGVPMANMMVTAGSGAERLQLKAGDVFETADMVLDFDSNRTFEKPVVRLFVRDGVLMMDSPVALGYLKMDDQSRGEIEAGEGELQTRMLYSAGMTSFVLRDFYPHAVQKIVSIPTRAPGGGGADALNISLRGADAEAEATVFGMAGALGKPTETKLGAFDVAVSYGSQLIELPFALKLEDFQLERYPGSMSPSSYASEVVLIDKEAGVERPYRIFMNHVLDYKGYRFFQSSYDQDELGTVLSVNNDPGTWVTYVGYLMLALGMFSAPFVKNGRYRELSEKARKVSRQKSALALLAAALLAFSAPQTAQAEEVNPLIAQILAFDKGHADRFGRLVVQDAGGRMKPLDTLNHEIVNKLYRGKAILGLDPNQIVLGMMFRPEAWREIKMIRTSHKEVNAIIGIDEKEKMAAFSQFFDYPQEMQGYKLNAQVNEAIRKPPGKRNKFDKAVLQVDERVNIAYMVYTGSLLRIWPKPDDAMQKWHATIDALQTFAPQHAENVRALAVNYFTALDEALQSGEWARADETLEQIARYQREAGAGVYPDQSKLDAETFYNQADIFERLWPFYFLVGFVLLFLSFVKILKPAFNIEVFAKASLWLLIVFFVIHTFGLALRWYISGHAPWSDGYESMIYIAWATVLAGFIFSKNSPMTMASTGILTGLILFVAHLNWMDPQVTNLVPVLKSYWLSIHVSMITASYGFLGLGALLGFITLLLFVFKNQENHKRIALSIKELNYINEMSLMIGLAMLTVGNFLGGVWANESWGRYWGWDPKETWALVTILVYAVVIHVRFIKPIYSHFSYAAISLLAFTSVLMTYFGVNYYLAGLHSYAKGDPVPIPDFVPVTYGIVFVIIALAYRKRRLA